MLVLSAITDLQIRDFPEDLCPTVLGFTTNHITIIDLHVYLLIQGKSFFRKQRRLKHYFHNHHGKK